MDGSESSLEALRFAIEEARLRGAGVRAVHVWHVPEGAFLAGFAPTAEECEDYEAAARRLLADAVSAATGADPPAALEQVLHEAACPATALVEESRDAALLVVGSRRRGALRELVAGSVGHECLRHATCPVSVVRVPGRRRVGAGRGRD